MAKRVPGQIRQDSMVLVAIVTVMREDEIRLERLQLLEERLDAFAVERKKTRAKFLDDDSRLRGAGHQFLRAHAGLPRSRACAAEHDPEDVEVVVIANQLQQRAAAPDLD